MHRGSTLLAVLGGASASVRAAPLVSVGRPRAAHNPGSTGEPPSVALLEFAAIQEAFVISVAPPPVRGIGTTGGFKMEVQDIHGGEPAGLESVAMSIVGGAAQTPGVAEHAAAGL